MHLPLATIVVVVGVGVRVVVGLIIKTTMRIVAKDRETTPLLSPLIGSDRSEATVLKQKFGCSGYI